MNVFAAAASFTVNVVCCWLGPLSEDAHKAAANWSVNAFLMALQVDLTLEGLRAEHTLERLEVAVLPLMSYAGRKVSHCRNCTF